MVTEKEKLCKEINKGITLHYLDTQKFKTTITAVLIRTKLCRETVTKNALLSQVLKKGCKKYPTMLDITKKTEEMYGSVFDIYILKKGEEQIICFYLEGLNVSPNHDDLYEEYVEFLGEMITQPLINENGFIKETVDREKKILKEKIKGRMDDKKEYAKIRCIEEMCKDEPFGIYADGYEEDVDKISEKSLYSHYQELLKSAPIEIVVTGNIKQEGALKNIEKIFDFKRKDVTSLMNSENKVNKKDVTEVEEKLDVLQGKLCIGFRSDSKPDGQDFYSLLVLNEILGGGASSRLFQNVREKESLCYYINSFIYRFKMILFLQAGIDKQNYNKTVEIIKNTVEELKSNDITDEELKNAQVSLIKNYSNIEDYQAGIMDFYITQYLLKANDTIEDFKKNIEKVTVEDVKKAVNTIELDTIYFLRG